MADGIRSVVPGVPVRALPVADGGDGTVAAAGLRHRHPVTPYEGTRLFGAVHRVWLRGEEPAGVLLTRERNT